VAATYPDLHEQDWRPELKAYIDDRSRTLAYAEDTANVAIVLNNGAFTTLPQTISVPPTDVDVTISWGCKLTTTVAGAGEAVVGPIDVTSGTVGSLLGYVGLNGSLLAGTWSKFGAPGIGAVNVGTSATWRVFRLYGFMGRDSASSLAVSISASGTGNAEHRTWLKAVAG
jgi:hypothetical protein